MSTMDAFIQRQLNDMRPQISASVLSPIQAALFRWRPLLRPSQLTPAGDWLTWVIRTGRGWGKTLVGSLEVLARSETCPMIAIVAATFGDGRDYCIEGETGIKGLCPDVHFNRSLGEVIFPSGAKAKLFSAEEPDRLRGPNSHFAWCDEFASWRYQKETWQMLMFNLRKGTAQTLITTTPRPGKLLTEIEKRPTTITTTGSSRENLSNLSPAYIQNVIEPYQGTRLGQQEIEGLTLTDVEGALWKVEQIEALRVAKLPDLRRVVVAVDPAATSSETADETGIIVAALGIDKQGYVLDDMTIRGTPDQWARQAIAAYHKYKADCIFYETNQGGEMVLHTLQATLKDTSPGESIRMVGVHASRAKVARAEPISALYEQGKVHHLGRLPDLEEQLTTWLPGDDSPDRLDALVWALTPLMVTGIQPAWGAFIA